MPDDPRRPTERLGFSALLLLTLAPMVGHGIWSPIARSLHTSANAMTLTFAALGVTVVAWIVYVLTIHRPSTWIVLTSASFAAVFFGTLLGSDVPGKAAASFALLVVASLSGVILPRLMQRLPKELDGLARQRKGATAWMVLLGILTITQTSRISTFIGDPTRTEMSVVPSVPFIVNHSCLTAYVEGARLATEGETNIYDAENWPDLSHSERSEANGKRYAPFALDSFAYPPTFLLLSRLLLVLPDFFAQRAAWFALNGLILAAGLWIVATWIDDQCRLRVLLLAPLVLICVPSILALQIGNVHAAVMVLGMLSMVAFETKRPALGGAMLAFAIASKISPGLLVIVLLTQRRYREVLWTAGFGAGFVLLGLLQFGFAPFLAFVTYQLPMLSSGKALGFLAEASNQAVNLAPFGVPFKLAFLGASIADPWKAAKHINTVFTIAIVIVTFFAARKKASRQEQAAIWLAILTLGTLRSPFAPPYVTFPVVWLLAVHSAVVRNRRETIGLALVWMMLAIPTPLPLPELTVFTLFQQVVILVLLMYSMFRTSGATPAVDAHGHA